jgi:hypothetical protein
MPNLNKLYGKQVSPWLMAFFWLAVLGALFIIGSDVFGRVQENVKKTAWGNVTRAMR